MLRSSSGGQRDQVAVVAGREHERRRRAASTRPTAYSWSLPGAVVADTRRSGSAAQVGGAVVKVPAARVRPSTAAVQA